MKTLTPHRSHRPLATYIQTRREGHHNGHGAPDRHLVRKHLPVHVRKAVELEDGDAVGGLSELAQPTERSGVLQSVSGEEHLHSTAQQGTAQSKSTIRTHNRESPTRHNTTRYDRCSVQHES